MSENDETHLIYFVDLVVYFPTKFQPGEIPNFIHSGRLLIASDPLTYGFPLVSAVTSRADNRKLKHTVD